MIHVSLPTAHLFPHLRSISWIVCDKPLLPCVHFLLAPGIVSITLGTFRSARDLSMLPVIALRCPVLADVTLIQDEVPSIPQASPVSSFICGLKLIRQLTVHHCDQSAFEHIARIHSLTTLALRKPLTTRPVLHYPQIPFPSLQGLDLADAPIQSILAVLCTVRRSPLTNVDIDITPLPDAATLTEICAALSPLSHLRTLGITSGSLFTVAPPLIDLDVIRPLLDLASLTALRISLPHGVTLTDAAVLELAKSWPQLEDLTLHADHKPQRPRTTLLSLISLARHCPKLEGLDMDVDASDVPDVARDAAAGRVVQHALRHWEVGDSLIVLPLRVAQFLSGLFPNLASIDTDSQQYENHHGRMQSVWGRCGRRFATCCRFGEPCGRRSGVARVRWKWMGSRADIPRDS
ncbi:hypothetical protein C8R46DRAFT_991039, partial [Mycena filopes]